MIALFLPSLRGGGAERVMVNLSKGFVEYGLKVDLVLVKAEGPYISMVPPEVRVIDLRASRVLTSLPKLIRYLKRERPEALLSAMDHTNIVALWARKLAAVQCKMVVSVHNVISMAAHNAPTARERFMPYFVRKFYPWADAIVAVSKGVADDLARVTGLSRESIWVIYNPIVISELLEKAKEPIGHAWFAPGQPPVILSVGRLTKQKDYLTLIRAFAMVRKERPIKLMILGEGAERSKLECLVHEFRLEEDISMPGFVENPYAYMARSSLFVLSSVWEGLPNVLIEAMACGCPIVATDCPSGPYEILDGGEYGKLVPVGNCEAMAKAIIETLDTPKDSLKLQKRASEFNLEKAVQQYAKAMSVLCHSSCSSAPAQGVPTVSQRDGKALHKA